MPELSPTETAAISRNFGLTEAIAATVNIRGMVNKTLELNNGHFLTIYPTRTGQELEAIGELAAETPENIPLARPIRGSDGYSLELTSGRAILTPRLSGKHYVGLRHTDKQPIPTSLHESQAFLFWELQDGLSGVRSSLKDQLQAPARHINGELPDTLPEEAKVLEAFRQAETVPSFVYRDLIHDDLERQNILSQGDKVTGVVDLDSLRVGDILYSFSHFLFNNVFCDPEYSPKHALAYIKELESAGVVDSSSVSSIYDHVYHFAVSDMADFQGVQQDDSFEKTVAVDLDLLSRQYKLALEHAASFFGILTK